MLYKFIKPVVTRGGWRKNKENAVAPKRETLAGPDKNFGEIMALLKKIKPRFAKTAKSPKFIKWLTLGCAALLSLLALLALQLASGLPNPNQLMERRVAQSTKIYDRSGETILYEIHGNEKRTIVGLAEIPAHAKWATIAIEDKDFYKHGGFSLWAMFRTVATNVLLGRKAGGSTLTQQFIKNAILTPEKSYIRKAKELILAYRLEKKFTKDEILQLYFNEIPYGSTAYGIEAASQKYFGKSVRNISLAEAAVLAALPQAPSRYSPYGSNKEILIARQQYILRLMVEQGHISEIEARLAKEEKLVFKEPLDNIIAPHFVMHIKELLTEKYGVKMVEEGGLKIYTTLDLYKQRAAEKAISDRALKNEKDYKATNAALVSIDPKTGQVLAMVGSKDYFNDEIDGQVNVALQPRQPGSSFKPIVYAASFIKGYTSDTVLYDVNTNFSVNPADPYEPKNYNGKEYGPVTIRQALAGSLNTPAVKTIYLAGIDNVLNLAENLGYSTLKDRSRFGLSLVLGGGEIKLAEHVNAFSAFAREGVLSRLNCLLKVEDKNGKLIVEYRNEESRVFDAQIARKINDILSDNSARAYIFGEKNWLTLGNRPVAAKTGTTNDNKDAWAVGYTPSLVTGVWVGNNNSAPMKPGADGSVVAAPIWNDYMKTVLGETSVEIFKKPAPDKTGKPVLDGNTSGEYTVKIDRASGLLATEFTPANYVEERAFIQARSILFYVDKNNPRGPAPAKPETDPQFNLWEKAIMSWAAKNNFSASTPPTAFDNVHLPENEPRFVINYPTNGQLVDSATITVNIDAFAPRGVGRVDFLLNGFLLAQETEQPFVLTKDISFLENGYHQLTIVVCDDVDNCSKKSLDFNFNLTDNQADKKSSVLMVQPDYKNLFKTNEPIMAQSQLDNYRQISRMDVYYKTGTSTTQLIQSYQKITAPTINTAFAGFDKEGSYDFFSEIYNWEGKKQTSNLLNIKVVK